MLALVLPAIVYVTPTPAPPKLCTFLTSYEYRVRQPRVCTVS